MTSGPIRRLRRRLSSVIGLPNIYGRLDHLDRQVAQCRSNSDLLDEAARYIFTSELRLKDYFHAFLEEFAADTDSRLDNHDENFRALLQELNTEIVRFIGCRSDDLSALIANRATALETQFHETVSSERSGFEHRLAQLQRALDDLRAVVAASQAVNEPREAASYNRSLDESFYLAFEDAFRGSESLIRRRQSNYLKIVEENQGGRILDIGCGRGEWLELLRDHGIDAIGVDTNHVAVARCVEKGLKVTFGSGMSSLVKLENSSLSGITLFQVLEHLSAGEIVELVREAWRTLLPAGVLVAEFPNIQVTSVGSNTFWLDPTHIRPLHPLFVEFVCKQVGFSEVSVLYPADGSGLQDPTLPDDDVHLRCPDVAIIAVK